jgi:hypothetical protein
VPAPWVSTFVTVLLFPFRAIERARGWGRVGLLVLYVVIGLPILALLWRRSQLIGLLDVGNSFEMAASRPHCRDGGRPQRVLACRARIGTTPARVREFLPVALCRSPGAPCSTLAKRGSPWGCG